jgi:hypothetical protein
MKRTACFVVLFLLSASFECAAQTVAEAAKLSDAQQQTIIMTFANNAMTNLALPKTPAGQPKSPEQYAADRTMANLVRALFTFDAKYADPWHKTEAVGLDVIPLRIKKAAAETPDKTVLEVMGEFVDYRYTAFYTDIYKSEQRKAEFAKLTDDKQVIEFRRQIELDDIEKVNEHTLALLEQRDKELQAKYKQMYDDAIILSDGRRVQPDQSGQVDSDFTVITEKMPDDANHEVKVEGTYKREAQRIYACMMDRRISTGVQAREAGCR